MAPKKQAKPEHVEGTEPEVEQELSTADVLENAVPDPDLEVELPIQSDGSLDDGFVSQSGVDLLEQLLGSSKAEESPKSGLVIPTKEEIKAVTGGDRRPTIAELEEILDSGGKVDIRPDGSVNVSPGLGLHPNGDYGIVIQVREGLWNGVSSQAEMERESPEVWLSRLVNEYLEGWFYGK